MALEQAPAQDHGVLAFPDCCCGMDEQQVSCSLVLNSCCLHLLPAGSGSLAAAGQASISSVAEVPALIPKPLLFCNLKLLELLAAAPQSPPHEQRYDRVGYLLAKGTHS